MSLINLNNITISFGGPILLDGISLQIQRGERVCLLGRNGTGKTTLMRLINGDIEPDKGTAARRQGMTTAHLPQEVPKGITGQVFDVVLGGLGKRGELPTQYHHVSARLAEESTDALLEQLDLLQKRLEAEGGWEIHRQAETVITRMQLDPDAYFETLSAGLKRRVLLARALVSKPDILLLDEPTNHLDIDAVSWLEEFLLRYEGSLLFVTHDRMLVKKLSSRIIELDRGRLFNWNCNYETYLERKADFLDAEQGQWAVFDKKLAKEEEWIRQGIKARRTRNEGRVTELLRMREKRRARREQTGVAGIRVQEAGRSGKLVVEAENVDFAYEKDAYQNKPIIRDFSTLIMRGDRVGIIGPNGSGKTTLLHVLLGRLGPQKGHIRPGTNLETIYFDQLRGQLDEEKSVSHNVADGNDRLELNGKTRHIIGYLQEFLFTPERSRSPVKVLSGGERNRLLLAKLFARPSNLLVMDEPTNDLDIETLELLEDVLINYTGTLLLVSHDRAFLNNVVTSTLVLEGEGRVSEYVGGYDDWLLQRPRPAEPSPPPTAKEKPRAKETRQRSRKLTNKEKHELETLPHGIEELETEQENLYNTMAGPDFYKQDGPAIAAAKERLETLKHELSAAYSRWEELEEIKDI